jgi:hypothetical protein
MAVSIGELQVETQSAPAAAPASSNGEAPKGQPDLRSAMQSLRERELRLEAD